MNEKLAVKISVSVFDNGRVDIDVEGAPEVTRNPMSLYGALELGKDMIRQKMQAHAMKSAGLVGAGRDDVRDFGRTQ